MQSEGHVNKVTVATDWTGSRSGKHVPAATITMSGSLRTDGADAPGPGLRNQNDSGIASIGSRFQ